MSLDDWNDGWIEGYREGIEKCIEAVAAISDGGAYDIRYILGQVEGLLHSLREVDTPRPELIEHINLDTTNRIGDDTTSHESGREPNNYPVGYDPRAAENRP